MLGLQHVVTLDIRLQHIAVAPPRGVRGLKYLAELEADSAITSHPLVGCVD